MMGNLDKRLPRAGCAGMVFSWACKVKDVLKPRVGLLV